MKLDLDHAEAVRSASVRINAGYRRIHDLRREWGVAPGESLLAELDRRYPLVPATEGGAS